MLINYVLVNYCSQTSMIAVPLRIQDHSNACEPNTSLRVENLGKERELKREGSCASTHCALCPKNGTVLSETFFFK